MTNAILPNDELVSLFTRFTLARRVETRKLYRASNEDEAFRAWLAGGAVRRSPYRKRDGASELVYDQWLEILDGVAQRQARVERLCIHNLPLTPYQRFRLEWYAPAAEAGEDIRLLSYSKVEAHRMDRDFWLFEGVGEHTYGVSMCYGPDNQFTHAEVQSPEEVADNLRFLEAHWPHATRLSDFKKALSPT